MKIRLSAAEGEVLLCEGVYDVSDAPSFGSACADIWTKLATRSAANSPNVGALYEALSDSLVPDLRQVQFRFERVDP